MESQMKFSSPQNISGASKMVWSWTTEVDRDYKKKGATGLQDFGLKRGVKHIFLN